MKCHMYLDTVILIVPGQPMYARGPLMLDEKHSMVVLQLVIHLFLNQACFILYFENRMSEELLFAKNEKTVTFLHHCLYQKMIFTPIVIASNAIC